MKREVNRYTIVQMERIETRRIVSRNYLNEIFLEIEKYNNNQKNPYFIGDIEVLRREGLVKFKKLKKITNPSTLNLIDNGTTILNSDYDLKKAYNTDKKNNHSFLLAYRVNKKVRTLPIVYKKNKRYLDRNYVKNSFLINGSDISFLNMILENEQIKASVRKSTQDFDNLYVLRESLKYNDKEMVNMNAILNFYKSFTTEGGDFNYFNFRLLGVLLMKYETSLITEREEDKEVDGQMIMGEYADLILSDTYDELKQAVSEEDMEKIKEKRLLRLP